MASQDKFTTFTSSRDHPVVAFFARGREIGYVRLEHGQLVRYGVKTIKGTRRGVSFRRRVEYALSSVLQTVEPGESIVLEQSGTRSTVGALCRTINDLSKHWKAQGYRVRFVSLDDVKNQVCSDDRVTYRELINATVRRYPLLWSLLSDPTIQRSKYWATVFLATALADVVHLRILAL